MSPSDLGQQLKPFVFLDLFEADLRALAGNMPVHPHSGIATVTVVTEGDATFDDPHVGHGTLGYGGVESVRAGRGMWHGELAIFEQGETPITFEGADLAGATFVVGSAVPQSLPAAPRLVFGAHLRRGAGGGRAPHPCARATAGCRRRSPHGIGIDARVPRMMLNPAAFSSRIGRSPRRQPARSAG
jgi:hypothetical protein